MNRDAADAAIMIVIPALNEQTSLGTVVRAARQSFPHVVVVDDFSSDATRAAGLQAGAQVLSLAARLGAWGATQTGLRYALLQGADTVVTLDADGQHEPALIRELLAPLHNGEADVVIGSCPLRVSPLRRLAWAYFRRLTGLRLEDLTSGFRAYNRRAIEVLTSPQATLLDYQDVGVLMLMRSKSLRVREVNIPITHRRDGISRVFSSWWMVFRYMVHTTVLCLANLSGSRANQGPTLRATDRAR
ncbi:glycosyltransferase family 2 protein [Thioalkalivibrio paradoxus]|uniref:Glycosyl transferase n=1 Tax=Thioalkalivibrio paradoxus ARh 1 TaxID=713585 RepID=W0DNC7_9GAMM|nr:glycosyltransferase family 2 protein [Thioalkalivibrio paradoxus]AHE98498.1 glycosyl transferase [Thioalkalivibrio paradoxus ARh 1]